MLINLNNQQYLLALTWRIAKERDQVVKECRKTGCDHFYFDAKNEIFGGIASSLKIVDIDKKGLVSLAAAIRQYSKEIIYIYSLGLDDSAQRKYWVCAIKNGLILPNASLQVDQDIESKAELRGGKEEKIELSGDMVVGEIDLIRYLLYLEKVYSSESFIQALTVDNNLDHGVFDKIISFFSLERSAIERNNLPELVLNIADQQRFFLESILKKEKKSPFKINFSLPKVGLASGKKNKSLVYGFLLLVILVGGGYFYFSDSDSSTNNTQAIEEQKLKKKKMFFDGINNLINDKNAYTLINSFLNSAFHVPISVMEWQMADVSYKPVNAVDSFSVDYIKPTNKHYVTLDESFFRSSDLLKLTSVRGSSDFRVYTVVFQFPINQVFAQKKLNFESYSAESNKYNFNFFIKELRLRAVQFELGGQESMSYGVKKNTLTIFGNGVVELLAIARMAKELQTFVLTDVTIKHSQSQNEYNSWVMKGEIYGK